MCYGGCDCQRCNPPDEPQVTQSAWTTEKPTTAGWYWYKDLDGAHILMIERVHHTDLFVSYEGSLTPLNEYHGEFAGPIPLPTEAQQARGSSGGAANHGAGT